MPLAFHARDISKHRGTARIASVQDEDTKRRRWSSSEHMCQLKLSPNSLTLRCV